MNASAVPTVAMAEPRAGRSPSSSSPTSDEGRFPVGVLLGERYKILGLLGRGGMGEVYRAQDLKLEQQVALKFLPPHNSQLVERFRAEVRIARQVSHRNVCRVYDLGEIDGAPFISMEYVDGEDLASVLRRFGRLPEDKAIEFARRLCAGLNAAHEKGVLHRDLKPANIMIDGQGQVRIMDFGLAAVADAVAGGDIRSGTPAYMAPEQKEGREVTVRSDIYSLGLVLSEMFTGQKTSGDSKLGTVKNLSPAIEKAIQRCLDPNPSKRPQSALDVSRALPGGDPLAEALAAGDTPSPEMVAASEDTGALSVRASVACLVFFIVGLIVVFAIQSKVSILTATPFPNSPEVLARKGQEIAARFGYTDPPVDRKNGFAPGVYAQWAQLNLPPKDYQEQTAAGQPSPVTFVYRQSPVYIESQSTTVTTPPERPGMIVILLDPQGRLLRFEEAPAPIEEAGGGTIDWNTVFEAAGLDRSRWTTSPPQLTPPFAFDERASWAGSYAHAPSLPLHIDAAAWKGRLVYFELTGPWNIDRRTVPDRRSTGQRIGQTVAIGLVCLLLVSAVLLAWNNYKRERADTQGAGRLAGFCFACGMIVAIGLVHHVPTAAEFGFLLQALVDALGIGIGFWVLYMALEPYARRRWPQSLITWSRVLHGSLRDPLAGGHALLGVALGTFLALGQIAVVLVILRINLAPTPRQTLSFLQLGPASVPVIALGATALALAIFFLFFLVRALLRSDWLAVALVSLVSGVVVLGGISAGATSEYYAATWVLQTALAVFVLTRFGILALAVGLYVAGILLNVPITSDFSVWWSGVQVAPVLTVVALAAWSFRVALGGRKVWNETFLE